MVPKCMFHTERAAVSIAKSSGGAGPERVSNHNENYVSVSIRYGLIDTTRFLREDRVGFNNIFFSLEL